MSVVPQSLRLAVFLDRDGTLNVDTGHITRPEDVELAEGAATGAARLSEAGYLLVVASNQSAVARGMPTPLGMPGIRSSFTASPEPHTSTA